MLVLDEFNIAPDTGKDMGKNFGILLAYCRENNVEKVVLPQGRYDIFADSVEEKSLALFNDPCTERKYALVLDHMHDFTLDGQGSTFVLHGEMTGMLINECENFGVNNVFFKCDKMALPQLTAIEQEKHSVIYKVNFPFVLERKKLYIGRNGENVLFDKKKNDYFIKSNDDTLSLYADSPFKKLKRIKQRGDSYLAFKFRGKNHFEEGASVLIPDEDQSNYGIVINKSKKGNISNVSFNAILGTVIHVQFSEWLMLNYIKFCPDNNGLCTTASGMKFYSCKGNIRVEDCQITGCAGNGINIRNEMLIIDRKEGNILVAHYANPKNKVTPFAKGDIVAIYDQKTKLKQLATTVTDVEETADGYTISVKACRGVEEGDLLVSASQVPNVFITWNSIEKVANVGVSVTASKDIKINENAFTKVGHSGISLTSDAFSIGTIQSCTIVNNNFRSENNRDIIAEQDNAESGVGFVRVLTIGRNNTSTKKSDKLSGAGKIIKQ